MVFAYNTILYKALCVHTSLSVYLHVHTHSIEVTQPEYQGWYTGQFEGQELAGRGLGDPCPKFGPFLPR